MVVCIAWALKLNLGFVILTISLEAKWVQIGADGHIIGSLLYLVGIGTWLSRYVDETGYRIGWALFVGIIGKILLKNNTKW